MTLLEYARDKIDHFHENHPNMSGRFYAIIAGFSVGVQAIIAKFITKGVAFTITCGIQSIAGFVVLLLIFAGRNEPPLPKDEKSQNAVFLRGFVGSLLLIIFNLGMRILPAPQFMVLHNTSSIWVVILGPFLLSEYPNRTIVAMVVLSFVGVALLIDPSFILPASLVSAKHGSEGKDAIPLYYFIVPMITGIGTACVGIFLRAFAKTVTTYQNAFHFLVFAAFYSGLFRIGLPRSANEVDPTVFDYFMMSLIGVSAAAFQFLYSLAAKLEPRASILSMLLNSQVVFAYVMDFLILGNPVDTINCVGGSIVVLCAVVIGFSKEAISSNKVQLTGEPQAESRSPAGEPKHGLLELVEIKSKK